MLEQETCVLLRRRPVTLREANEFVQNFHRHNGRTARDGGKYAIGAELDGEMVGVAIVGNPISATYMDGYTAEVLRLCTNDKAPKGCCSMLYQACWRAWKAMGGKKLITYTLKTESGASLRGAGWKVVGETVPIDKDKGWKGGSKDAAAKPWVRREWQPVMGQQKLRWEAT